MNSSWNIKSGDILQCDATIELQKWIGLSIRVINWGVVPRQAIPRKNQ